MEKKDKITIKQFKSGESSWWVNQAHYYLDENQEVIWCSGESDKTELRDYLISFIKRNKKVHVKRPKNIFENE